MAEPIGTAVGEKVAENLVDRILNSITVVRKCNENVQNLKNEVEALENKIRRVKRCIEEDVGRRAEEIDEEVQAWLTKAEKFIKPAGDSVRVGDEFARNECFFRLCPNPLPRYKLSKKAAQISGDIAKHVQEAHGFDLPLSHAPPPQQVVAAVVKGFEEFPSRMAVLEQIMKALRNPIVNKIGVYGTSGVGKTTLVKMVRGKAKQDSLFTVVVMATVTKDRDLTSIQEDIARDLGFDQLSFRERTERQVADLIKAELMKKKKFLVILDDVWDTEIDFEKFGIPSAGEMEQANEKKNGESSSRQEDMLCKILLTSRFHNVLFGMVGEKDKVLEVHKLRNDEAWHLFKKIVGNNVESSNFQPTAKEIVEKCIGLPVAIVSVGKAMRGKTQQFEWDRALTELKKPSPDGISAAVYKPIELNYNNLKEEELKQTFILCSLLSRNSSIDDLLKCGMGLDLFQKVNTIEETRAKVLSLVSCLKQSSLLVDGKSSSHFDMHDQIQEVALSIAFRDHGGLALVDEVTRRKLKSVEKLKWISLPNGDIELPANGFQCPQLTFFYLSDKARSLQFPPEFLKNADGLHVLCLTKVDFKSMPLSIPLIPTNLHSLLLDQSAFNVEGLRAIMGNLENLEVLSLAGCDIEELPREIEKLSKLKLLDLSDCTKLRVIPRQVLASLSRSLEELKMGNSFNQWDVEEGIARLDELAELHKLTALEVCIPNFRVTLFPENLRRFKIFLGEVWYSWDGSIESSKRMKLRLQGASIKSGDSVKKLLKKTEDLYLEDLNGVDSLVDGLDDEGFQHLKCLEVQNAPDIRYISNQAGSQVPSHVFPILEVLTLFNLEKMEKICHGLTGAAPFKVLRKITVVGCHQLKNLFSICMARQLQLQEITVENCKNIEEIIDDVEEQGNGNDIVEESEGCKLGNSLRSLTLRDLPKLISFNSSNCGNISLFNDKFLFRNLEELILQWINVDMIWIASYCVENLTKLIIRECDNLKYLFSSTMVRSLLKLGHLEIRNCEMMTEILSKENEEKKGNLIFPQLKFLLLKKLKNLVSFYFGDSTIEFSSLNKLIVRKCPAFKGFAVIPTSTDVAASIQPIFNKQDSFPCLEQLEISKCHGLENLVSYSTAKSLKQLERMSITSCDLVEEIVKCLEDNVKDSIVFSQLKSLQLCGLPKLSSFCSRKCDFELPSLKEVTVIGCPQMKYFSLGKTVTKVLQNVKWIYGKEKGHWVSDLNSTIQDLFIQKVGYLNQFGSLMKLSKFSEIEIWKKNLEELALLSKRLQYLEVSNCNRLSYLLTSYMVLSLVQLKDLKVKHCAAMEQVIMVTGVVQIVETGLILPQLKSISLESCSKLSSFYVGSNTLKLPMLEEITIKDCLKMVRFASKFSREQEREIADGRSEETPVKKEPDIFNKAFLGDEVEFPNLKLLKLSSINISLIRHNQISENPSIKNLKELVVEGCGTLKYLFTFSIVGCFQQLIVLKICSCKMMEGVIVIEQLEEEKRMSQIFFPKLDSLVLQELPKLTRFYSGNCFEFASLTELTISKCSMLKTFISGSAIGNMTVSTENEVNAAPSLFYEKVEFPNLKLLKLSSININQIWNKNHEEISSFKRLQHLEVCNCSSLSYLLTPFMALGLVQLKDLTIKDCETMEQVIMAVGVEEVVETGLTFPQLNYILLESCSKLSSFYVGSNTLKLPMLEEITIKDCLNMVRFATKFSSVQDKEIADGRSEEVHVKEEPDIFIDALFCDEVEIPTLETLTLSSINIKQIWNNQLSSVSSFAQHLTKLKVVNCSDLKYMFTFSMVKSFVQLKELGISGSETMEVVILIEGTVEEEKICQTVFPKLKTLTLNDLPQLATFCSNCDSPGKISDSGRVNFDTRSQKLPATQSTLVETEATKLVFSQLIELMLRLLPKFKSFFPQTHIAEWPSLKSLVVIECQGAQIVASEFSSTEMTRGDSQLERESENLMFWISKATFPNLERLVVKWNDNIKIQCGHHPEEYFGKLKVLHLLGFPKQSAFRLPFFFHSLPNLEKLLVKDAFFDETFQCEEVSDEEKQVCGRTPLRNLRLSKLHELTHLWKEESQLEVDILRNLETLKVQECSRLKNLVPSTVYFDNLETLVVSECHGLVNLVRYSTAKCLGQLRRMKVANCEMIEEIVSCSGDDVNDGIVFSHLWSLQLKGLPRLESFCSGDCNFKFPDLREVIITECPNMQIFSKGELSTPELDEVKLTGDIYEYMDKDIDEDIEKKIDDIFNKDEGGVKVVRDKDERCWVRNLNSTVQQLFKEKHAHNSKKGNGENSDHGAKEDGN